MTETLSTIQGGEEFGMLTVVWRQGDDVECRCSCGEYLKVPPIALITGRKRSCGCRSRKPAPPEPTYSDGYVDGLIFAAYRLVREAETSARIWEKKNRVVPEYIEKGQTWENKKDGRRVVVQEVLADIVFLRSTAGIRSNVRRRTFRPPRWHKIDPPVLKEAP